jgi:hypothetical protein
LLSFNSSGDTVLVASGESSAIPQIAELAAMASGYRAFDFL